jgi:hypothetical protein
MKAAKLIILSLVLCSLLTGICKAQWQPEVILTHSGPGSLQGNNARCFVSSGDWLHLIWRSSSNGFLQVFYKHSTDKGISWSGDTKLTNNNNYYVIIRPSVSVSGEVVHVVWQESRLFNFNLYYERSTDAGMSWGADTELTFNSNLASTEYPAIFASGQVVHLTWQDSRDGNEEIYYKRSTDGGTSWGADLRLTNNPAYSLYPSLSVSGQDVHIVWQENRDGNYEIYYKHSADAGVSWGADTRLTNNSSASFHPCVSGSDAAVYVVWYDYPDGNYEIYCKRSTDSGVSWGVDTRLTNNPANSTYPSLTVSGQDVHVVWQDKRVGYDGIYYKRSPDGGISWSNDTSLTITYNPLPAYSSSPSVLVTGEVVHTVWLAFRDGGIKIYYKRNPTGNTVGINIIGSEIPKEFSLYQNYPNPFNPATHLRFEVSELRFVNLKIYDMLGREAAELVSGELKPGTYEVEWNASDYPSGVYFYKLISGDFVETKKMILIK